mmetsp:Transcript_7876/g.21491  ORF Transcript_7876/g.21491 Transcript_7876/m.21491 type:complete len:152 (+) Transcript_7876:127-582(+)|eukprot:CAMPEP_0185191716 /NCGR_PEP_ID=MMETSP1140-20130426/16407_1 /TAXON_ID=298111 /ORGANISM="Pavlova sp., Strain CCMP459" /LENGTH=151 /DNA_ID=CAMNT_0027758431 /DNA_START=91 /DNA_END=546 /DNA_ORIENTATION=+
MGACGSKRRNPASSNPIDQAINNITNAVNDGVTSSRRIPETLMRPVLSCLCYNLFLTDGDIAGVRCLQSCLWIDCAFCMHANAPKLDCICFDCHISNANTLCSAQYQTCCVVNSFSMPPGVDTVSLVNVAGINLYPKVALCETTQGIMLRV